MRVVAAGLPVEIHGRVLRIVGGLQRPVLRLETLVARPRFEQRAIDGEMLVRQQPLALDRRQHLGEERVRHRAIEQAVAILGEDRRVPDRIIEAQPDKPPIQDAVVQLLHQQALAAHAVEQLQQQRPQQLLRRNRRAARRRIQAVELRRQALQHVVHQAANRAQRMVAAHPRFRRYVAEHRGVLQIVTTHRGAPVPLDGSILERPDPVVDPLGVRFSASC